MNRRMTKRRRLFLLAGNNRGNTLIEVIVCVLIIGIAFVPLMVGLNTSLRINKNTENKLYAENVASNIVEICKTYGKQGLEELKGLNSDTTKGIKAFLAGDSVTLSQDPTDEMVFYVSNISSGMEEKNYYAEIKFDDSAYSTTQNDFSAYQSISGLTDAVVISFDPDNLESVVHKFYEIAQETGTEAAEADMIAEAASWLKRQITVEVKPVIVDDKTRYVVDAKIEYSADGTASAGSHSIFKGTTITSVTYQTRPCKKLIVNGSERSGESEPDPELTSYKSVPKSVIVTYSQLKSNSGTYVNLSAPSSSTYDMIVRMLVNGGRTNVYALCMDLASLTPLASYSLKSQVTDYYGTTPDWAVGIYSNLNSVDHDNPELARPNYTNCRILEYFGDGSTGKQSKLKDIVITVKNCDESGAPQGDPIVEKNSTIIEFE